MSFVITALQPSQFQHLFALDTEALASQGAMRVVAHKKPGFPCRVSLADAEIGEEVILAHYEHQPADSPFRASHAVYLRPGVPQAELAVNTVPEMLRSRILSLRGFDEKGMIVAAELVDGKALESALTGMLAEANVAYVHLHFAKPGCYAARADRA